jgi:hypothetical protein
MNEHNQLVLPIKYIGPRVIFTLIHITTISHQKTRAASVYSLRAESYAL